MDSSGSLLPEKLSTYSLPSRAVVCRTPQTLDYRSSGISAETDTVPHFLHNFAPLAFSRLPCGRFNLSAWPQTRKKSPTATPLSLRGHTGSASPCMERSSPLGMAGRRCKDHEERARLAARAACVQSVGGNVDT